MDKQRLVLLANPSLFSFFVGEVNGLDIIRSSQLVQYEWSSKGTRVLVNWEYSFRRVTDDISDSFQVMMREGPRVKISSDLLWEPNEKV